MSLMRFLVVGSSLRGVKDRPSPYKMTQQHLLPKFGPGKDADGKAGGAVLTATSGEDGSDESTKFATKVATKVTGEECDGDLQPACSETEEMKAELPAVNLK